MVHLAEIERSFQIALCGYKVLIETMQPEALRPIFWEKDIAPAEAALEKLRRMIYGEPDHVELEGRG